MRIRKENELEFAGQNCCRFPLILSEKNDGLAQNLREIRDSTLIRRVK